MSVSPDCLIIGGGLVGMLTARELALAGMQVQLLERGETGSEASWAGGGILSPLYPWRYADPVSVLARASQAIYVDLITAIKQESGIDPQLCDNGLLMPACTEQEPARQWAAKFSANLQYLDATETALCAPELAPAIAEQGALWLPDVKQVRNPRFVKALRASLNHLGVTVTTGQSVSGLITENQTVCGVETEQGQRYSADHVVVTMGAWSASLWPSINEPVAIRPVKGQMLLYKTAPGAIKRIHLYNDRYVIPRRDGRVLVGSTLEDVGFEKSTTAAAAVDIAASATQIVPLLAECEIERHWAGLRPGSPNGIPYIGAHPTIRGLYINAGHYRYGVILGPASAQLISDIILNNKVKIDKKAYAVTAVRA